MDKNYLIFGISSEHEIAENWTLSSEITFETGGSDKNMTAVRKSREFGDRKYFLQKLLFDLSRHRLREY